MHEIAQQGIDWERVLQDMAETLHQIAMLQLLPPKGQSVDSSLALLAKTISAEDIQFYYQLMLNGRKELAYSPEAKTGVEMTILRALAFHPKRFAFAQPVTNQIVTANEIKQSQPTSVIQSEQKPSSSVENKPQLTKPEVVIHSEAKATIASAVEELNKPEQKVTPDVRSSALLSSDILQQVASLEQGKPAHIAVEDKQPTPISEKKKVSVNEANITATTSAAINFDKSTTTITPEQQVTVQTQVNTSENVTPTYVTESHQATEQAPLSRLLQDDNAPVIETTEDTEIETTGILNEDYHWSWSDPTIDQQQQAMRPSDIKKALLEKYTPEVVEKVVERANERSQWSADIEKLELAGGSKRILLNSVVLEKDEHFMRLGVRPESFLLAKYLDLSFINKAFQDFYGRKIKIELEEYTGPEVTPYEIRGEIYQQMVEEAQQKLQQDQKLNQFMQQFAAKIDLDSVRPTGKE